MPIVNMICRKMYFLKNQTHAYGGQIKLDTIFLSSPNLRCPVQDG